MLLAPPDWYRQRAQHCAVKGAELQQGATPAREPGSLHPEAIGAAVEETKPSQPPL